METGVVVRHINLEDKEAISALSEQLGYPVSDDVIKKHIFAIINHDDHCAFAALHDGQVIGWIHAFFTIRVESEPFVEIAGLVVDEKYRRKSAGKELVDAVRSWAITKNVATIKVRSNILRLDAHEFYYRTGFTRLKDQRIFSYDL